MCIKPNLKFEFEFEFEFKFRFEIWNVLKIWKISFRHNMLKIVWMFICHLIHVIKQIWWMDQLKKLYHLWPFWWDSHHENGNHNNCIVQSILTQLNSGQSMSLVTMKCDWIVEFCIIMKLFAFYLFPILLLSLIVLTCLVCNRYFRLILSYCFVIQLNSSIY